MMRTAILRVTGGSGVGAARSSLRDTLPRAWYGVGQSQPPNPDRLIRDGKETVDAMVDHGKEAASPSSEKMKKGSEGGACSIGDSREWTDPAGSFGTGSTSRTYQEKRAFEGNSDKQCTPDQLGKQHAEAEDIGAYRPAGRFTDYAKRASTEAKHAADQARDAAMEKAHSLEDRAVHAKDELKDRASYAADELKNRVSYAKDELKNRASYAADRASHTKDELKDRASDAAEELKDRASDTYERAKDTVSETATEAKAKAQDAAATAREKGESVMESVKHTVADAATAVEHTASSALHSVVDAVKSAKDAVKKRMP